MAAIKADPEQLLVPAPAPDELAAVADTVVDHPLGEISDMQAFWLQARDYLDNKVKDPVQWLRTVHPENFYVGCRQLFAQAGVEVAWSSNIDAVLDHGGAIQLPITAVAFGAATPMAGQLVDSCWRAVSKCRCMSVLERIFLGGKGLDTSTDLPTLVVDIDMRGKTLEELIHIMPHASGSTRLMAGHIALRLLLIFENTIGKVMHLPEVQAAVRSLASLTCHCRTMTAVERTVWGLGASDLISAAAAGLDRRWLLVLPGSWSSHHVSTIVPDLCRRRLPSKLGAAVASRHGCMSCNCNVV
jgi:hypothetical protein